MQYYKKGSDVRALENPELADVLLPGFVPITEAEAREIKAPSIEQAKEQAWQAIKAERDRRIQTGGYKVGTKWYHSDTFSRTQQIGLVMLGANIPAGTQWKTMDGSVVTMTQTLATQIFAAAAASDIAVFAAAETHKAAMQASADPASYDFSTDWPPIFEESILNAG